MKYRFKDRIKTMDQTKLVAGAVTSNAHTFSKLTLCNCWRQWAHANIAAILKRRPLFLVFGLYKSRHASMCSAASYKHTGMTAAAFIQLWQQFTAQCCELSEILHKKHTHTRFRVSLTGLTWLTQWLTPRVSSVSTCPLRPVAAADLSWTVALIECTCVAGVRACTCDRK